MNTANHLSQDDLALFALQLLPEEEANAAWLHVQQCATCRGEVGGFQGDLALCSMASDLQTPPAGARDRLLRQIALEKRVAPADMPAPVNIAAPMYVSNGTDPVVAARGSNVLSMERPAKRAAWITWAGWAVAAAFALAAGLQFHARQQMQGTLDAERATLSTVQANAAASQVAMSALTDPTALNVTLRQPAAKGAEAPHLPEGHAAYLPDRGALVFVANNLEPLKPYKVYELWLLPAEKGLPPIPAASFRPDAAGNANVVLPTGPKLLTVKGFGVTVEDDNAAPKQPTLPILLMGSSKT